MDAVSKLAWRLVNQDVGFMFNVLWWHSAYWGKLTSHRLTAAARRATTIAWAPAPLLIAGVAALGFIEPRLAFGGFLVIGLTYMLPMHRIVVAVARGQSDGSLRKK